ncbi:MAG: DCC1-like thiol-disulfide oxidoreductase family protein [Chlamydiae bacterium]|nr:DCC1-like thiol-disulfide oxidoreductase family protein [Chlamydiota bacterium]
MSEITVIYDGDCILCKNSINWLGKGLTFKPIPFQNKDLASFGLSKADCEKQVYAISGNNKYGGVSAVIFLLNKRGNKISSSLLRLSGPIGSFVYKK